MDLASQVLEPHGLECIEAEWQGHDRILRLYVDTRDRNPGFDLDGCVKASRILSEEAGLDDRIKGAYTLEVSSPGVERPLRRAEDFRRHVGSRAHARLSEKLGERRQGEGIITAVSDRQEGETQEIATKETWVDLDTAEGKWTFPLSSLAKANLIYDWNQQGNQPS